MPKKPNRAKEVREQIDSLLAKRQQEIETIQMKCEEVSKALAQAETEAEIASNVIDSYAYGMAKDAQRKAKDELEMYQRRLQTITAKEYISEADSDAVIDSLLAYENELSAEFEADIARPLGELQRLVTAYRGAIREAEDTITAWTGQIHANYRASGMSRLDPETGTWTNRSATPVPVHPRYTGCMAGNRVNEIISGPLASFIK